LIHFYKRLKMLRTIRSLVCHNNCTGLLRSQIRFAGHNKWSNIKHIKAAKDQLNSKRNTMFTSRITIAIKEQGMDNNPETNSKLRKVLADARASNVPKATLENALKHFKNNDSQEFLIPVQFNGGILLLVEGLAKNRIQVESDINGVLKRKGGKIQRGTGFLTQFEQKGVIIAEVTKSFTEDVLEEDAIESGAEEVDLISQEDKTVEFTTCPHDMAAVKTTLEERGYAILDAAVNFLPLMPASPREVDKKAAAALVESLENKPTIVNVYLNF